MKKFNGRMLFVTVGMWVIAIGVAGAAEQTAKPLPTLLIKGELVSVNTSDATQPSLVVKDRYAFETPVYLKEGASILKGETALRQDQLAVGSSVEIQYNFDVNTAKRHAVSVKVTEMPAAPAESAEAVVVTEVETAVAEQPEANIGSEEAPEQTQPSESENN